MTTRAPSRLAPLGLMLAFLLGGCPDREPAAPLKALAPAPLRPLVPASPAEGGPATSPEAAPRVLWGQTLPPLGRTVRLQGSLALFGGKSLPLDAADLAAQLRSGLSGAPVVLVPDADTFLVQVSPLLAALDDLGLETWLAAPSGGVGYRLALRDEPAFNRWLDEPKPGKVRIIQRADGLELTTNVGKVPGGDPNGPSVPLRQGTLDVATLRAGLTRLKERFGSDELCLVPSFGTPLAAMAAALSGDFRAPGKALFSDLCLVYPRPGKALKAPGVPRR